MSDQVHDNNGQLSESQEKRPGSELNNWSSTQAVVDSSNPLSNQATTDHVPAPRPPDPFRDYVNNTCFDSLVSVVQDAPEKCLPVCANVLSAMMDAKKLIYLFERVRRHAVHHTRKFRAISLKSSSFSVQLLQKKMLTFLILLQQWLTSSN